MISKCDIMMVYVLIYGPLDFVSSHWSKFRFAIVWLFQVALLLPDQCTVALAAPVALTVALRLTPFLTDTFPSAIDSITGCRRHLLWL